MKLRIKGNTIRLRLSQSEVAHFAEHAFVKEEISFLSSDSSLVYSLYKNSSVTKLTASFQNHEIRIEIPERIASNWVNSEQVGIQNDSEPGANEEIFILIEKDFQCLHKRSHEDESDNFQNPAMQAKR